MAKVWSAPIDPPEIDWSNFDIEQYTKTESDYIEQLAELARRNGSSKLLGEEVRWQRGDGYARYMVWSTSPRLELVHLDLGDGWQVEDALIRGLRVSDVKQMVEREQAIRELFSKKG